VLVWYLLYCVQSVKGSSEEQRIACGGSLQYQTDVQGRFQFSEEIKDSSLKSLVVFIIAKRRVKSDTGCGGMVGNATYHLQQRQRFKPCCPGFAVFRRLRTPSGSGC
jgi:hypothetical protein